MQFVPCTVRTRSHPPWRGPSMPHVSQWSPAKSFLRHAVPPRALPPTVTPRRRQLPRSGRARTGSHTAHAVVPKQFDDTQSSLQWVLHGQSYANANDGQTSRRRHDAIPWNRSGDSRQRQLSTTSWDDSIALIRSCSLAAAEDHDDTACQRQQQRCRATSTAGIGSTSRNRPRSGGLNDITACRAMMLS